MYGGQFLGWEYTNREAASHPTPVRLQMEVNTAKTMGNSFYEQTGKMHEPPGPSLELAASQATFTPSNLLSTSQEKFKNWLLPKDPGENALFPSGEVPASIHHGQEMGELDNFSALFLL